MRMLDIKSDYGYVFLADERPSLGTGSTFKWRSTKQFVFRCVLTCIFASSILSSATFGLFSSINGSVHTNYLFLSLSPDTFSFRCLTVFILVAGPLVPALIFARKRHKLRSRTKADFHSCEPGYSIRTNEIGHRVVTIADASACSDVRSHLQNLRPRGRQA